MTPIWMNLYPPVSAAHITAQGGKGWIVGAAGALYTYDDVNYVWQSNYVPSSSPLVDISASTDGTLVGVCANGNVYMWSYGSWNQLYISSRPVTNASVGDINDVAVVDNTGAVIRQSSTYNSNLAPGPVKVSGTLGLGQIWGVGSTGTVYKWNPSTSSWNTIAGKTLVQIHVSLSATKLLQVVGVDSNGKGWSYDSTTGTWTSVLVPNSGDHFTWLEAGSGYIWGLLTNGSVYRGFI